MRAIPPLCLALTLGCATSPIDRAWLARRFAERTGHPTRAAQEGPPQAGLPPGASLDDGLTEDEAVAIALWNHPGFQSDLSQLGFARADLADAGMLPNPILALLLPLGPRQIEGWLSWPVEVLWQRPRRVEAARLEVARVGESLVQTGLDVARDARLAHAELTLARARAEIRAELAATFDALTALAERRAAAGDLGDAEVAAFRVDAGLSHEQHARATMELALANARLLQAIGHAERQGALITSPPEALPPAPPETDVLTRTALAARPDVRAAELALEAAGARRGWELSRIFGLVARVDGFSPAPGGAAPTSVTGRAGLQMTLPIFQQNQGGIGRADAEIERATWRYAQTRQQVVTDVVAARAQLAQALAAIGPWRATVLPAAEEAVRGATRAFALGDTAYIAVLDATRRLLEARLREAELVADARRAAAQLDRSLGGRHAPR